MEPSGWIIVLALIIWCLLFWAVYSLGMSVIDRNNGSSKRKWGMEEPDHDHKKWKFRFYTIVFFVGIPILVVVALIQESV